MNIHKNARLTPQGELTLSSTTFKRRWVVPIGTRLGPRGLRMRKDVIMREIHSQEEEVPVVVVGPFRSQWKRKRPPRRQMESPRGESRAKCHHSASSADTPSWAARSASRLPAPCADLG
jgi:hypothetical protein